MPDTPSTSQRMTAPDRSRSSRRGRGDPDLDDRRAALARVIPRRAGVSWWLGVILAVGFAALATPAISVEHWLLRFGSGSVAEKLPAPFTVRAPMLAGYEQLRIGGGVVVARGEPVTRDQAAIADAIAGATPRGPVLYLAFFALTLVLAAIFTHHMRRSIKGRLVRVQIVSFAVIAVLAVAVKLVMLSTALSALVVPVALLAIVPTMVLDRIVGLATGVLAALVVSLQAPFDVGLAILLLVQAATAGLVVTERPKRRWIAALGAGLVTTLCTAATYLLLTYLTTGGAPELRDPLHSAWVAAAVGPAIAGVLAVPLVPLYQLLVGEITQGKLFALEDLGHPLLRQIAERAPGTWQHSLMMANMAEIAANAIGASGRLVRVGAYFHDLGKSLSPKYFIENLEPGETSPHDQLPPEVSCDAIFAHVTEGIVTARKAGLHERIVDFMHMHHGNGVLEYFWAKCREQGNPHGFTIEDFRYPGHPPQSRETAILAICDAVEAASRTLKKPDAASIDSLVQRIVYGKLHLGQLDESGLSMGDLRRISDSLRETIRHANHARIEYPWQKAGQDASASVMTYSSTSPRLDSLDRKPGRDTAVRPSLPPPADSDAALAATANVKDPDSGSRPAAYPVSSEPGDARIRAGTARNAYASSPPVGDSGDAGRVREVRASEIFEAEAREAAAREAEAREEAAREAAAREAAAREAEAREAAARVAALREAAAREAALREAAAREAALREAAAREAAAREAESAAFGRGHRVHPETERRGSGPYDDSARDPGRHTRTTEPGPIALRAAASAPRRDSSAALGDGMAAHRDPGSAPNREPRTTLREGTVAIREPGATSGRDPITLRGGVTPHREPAASRETTAQSRDPITLRDGVAPSRDPGSSPLREGTASHEGTASREGTAPSREGTAPSREGIAPSRDPITLRDSAAPSRDPGSPALRDGVAAVRDPGSPPAGDAILASGDPITLRDGVVPNRDVASTLRDGGAAVRDPGSPSISDGIPTTSDPITLRGGALSSRDAAAARGDEAPSRDAVSGDGAGVDRASPLIVRVAGPASRMAPTPERTEAPDREPATTSPRRAPGSLGPPPDLITPQVFEDEPVRPARSDAATTPPAPAQQSPTTPPPLASPQAAAEPARSADPPTPVDLDNAITNPPPLRRGPSGHPPIPSDPAQIAAALANLVSRVRAAPFGVPVDGDDAAHGAAQHDDLDNAITNPPPLGSLAPRTLSALDDAVTTPPRSPGRAHGTTNPIDNVITRPLSPSPTRAARPTPGADSAITEPLLATAPAPALRTSGLADDDGRPNRAPPPPPDPGDDEPITVRRRASTSSGPGVLRPPAPVSDDEARVTLPRPATQPSAAADVRGIHERHEHHAAADPDLDAGVTEPSLPVLAVGDERRVDLPLRIPPASAQPDRAAGWSRGLAARIDAALDSDEWNNETPIVPPTNAELRALLGQPDPTRQQPVDEIELLQRRAAELGEAEPPRRSPHPTAEVDPDDIEAAIELAPPARRPTHPNAIGAVRPRPRPKQSE